MDVYLAVTQHYESNFGSKINVQPKRIVVFGDSAGGHMSLSLGRFLHKVQIELPKYMCLLYPVSAPFMYPSMISHRMCLTDVPLTVCLCYNSSEAYCPGNAPGSGHKQWFRRECDSFKTRCEFMRNKCNQDEIFNPMLGDISCFKDTRMVALGAQFDPILDDCVEICKKWPAKAELAIAEKVPHAFVMDASEYGQEAFRKLVDMLKSLASD